MRVALYVRVSTTGQVEAQTIEQQIERLQAHVENEGWLLSAEHSYRDDGYSGAKLNRPGLDSLRDRAALAEFDVVLVTAPDRLSRNYVHQMLLLEELTQHGVRVEFLDRPMSDDPHDRLLLQIRSAVAEYERTLITDRMRRGRLRKLRAGQLLPWPIPPYSYRTDPENPRDPKGIQLDETEAAIVAEMFAWYLQPGATLGQVARRLNDLGIPTPRGKSKWHPSTVGCILRNPIYMGVTYANRFRSIPSQRRRSALAPVGQGKSLKLRPEDEWIPLPMPAVVSDEVFAQVQEKLKHNQQTASRNNKAHDYLLRGRVSCGHCRLSANAKTLKSKYPYYVCQGRHIRIRAVRGQGCPARYIPATQLDELVWQDLCEVLTEPAMIAKALERAHGGHWLPQELQARIKTLKQAQKQLTRQQERLLEAYLAEVVELPELKRKQHELKQKQAALEQQLQQLNATTQQREALTELFPPMETFCQQTQPVLEAATFAQRRQLVELLIDRVIVTDDEVEIRYVIPTQPDGPRTPFMHLRTNYL